MKNKNLAHVVNSGRNLALSSLCLALIGLGSQSAASADAISLAPAGASVTPCQTVTFTAPVTGTTQTGVTWSPVSNGTLTPLPGGAIYTAPCVIQSAATLNIVATSTDDPTASASATITLVPQITVNLTPAAAILDPGSSQQIAASVTGASNQAVTWSLSPALGTIDATGLYTAPPSLATQTVVTIQALSAADSTTVATAAVTVRPSALTVTMGTKGLTSLQYLGANLLYQVNTTPSIVHVTQTNASGVQTLPSKTPTSVVTNASTNTVTATYAWGIVTTTYSVIGNKLQTTVKVTNTSTDMTLTHMWMFPYGIQLPSTPSNLASGTGGFNLDAPTTAFWNFGTGTLGFANEDVVKPLSAGFWPASSPAASKWYVSLYFDNGHSVSASAPILDRPIPPGSSDQYVTSIRFGSPLDTSLTLLGDIFTLYRNTFPRQVTPPAQNRPMAALNATSRRRPTVPTNPRGWLNADPTIDVTTSAGIAAFQSKLLKWADGAVIEMKRVGAQGGILWDLEGQQYDEAYIGDPSQIETIAPEMVGVLDAFVGKFTSAGLHVGFTLRPQVFTQQTGFLNVSGTSVTWAGGTPFSPGWAAGPNVSTSIVIGGNNYQIQSVSSSTSMTLALPAGTGTGLPFIVASQTNVADPGAVLQAKIQYVTNRFGPLANLFYVDSNLAWDGTVTAASYFQKLLTANPNALIFPEWENPRHYAYTIPYNNSLSGFFTPPPTTMAIYPNAISLIKVNDPAAVASPQQLLDAARAGNILLFDGWYRHTANDVVLSIYSQLP